MARSLCIYGPTGTWKTSQIKWFARRIAEVTGKATLLLSTDGGGWAPCDPEIIAGMIVPWRLETANTPLSLLRKVSKGFWPKNVDQINEAIAKAFQGSQDFDSASMVPIDWSLYGAIAVEGLTSIGSVVMRYLPDNNIAVGGENRQGKDGNMQFKQGVYVDQGNGPQGQFETFGSNTRGDYGFAQNTLYGLVNDFSSLPCHSVLFTALEAKTTEDGEKMGAPTYGPAMPGKIATAQCGPWFGDLLHGQDYMVPRTTEVPDPADPKKTIQQTVLDVRVRYFYKKHPDPQTGILFPAKPRCAPERITELEAKFPGGFFEPTTDGGLDRYMAEVDRLAEDASRADSLLGWRERTNAILGRK
jgi:hypothetical protein